MASDRRPRPGAPGRKTLADVLATGPAREAIVDALAAPDRYRALGPCSRAHDQMLRNPLAAFRAALAATWPATAATDEADVVRQSLDELAAVEHHVAQLASLAVTRARIVARHGAAFRRRRHVLERTSARDLTTRFGKAFDCAVDLGAAGELRLRHTWRQTVDPRTGAFDGTKAIDAETTTAMTARALGLKRVDDDEARDSKTARGRWAGRVWCGGAIDLTTGQPTAQARVCAAFFRRLDDALRATTTTTGSDESSEGITRDSSEASFVSDVHALMTLVKFTFELVYFDDDGRCFGGGHHGAASADEARLGRAQRIRGLFPESFVPRSVRIVDEPWESTDDDERARDPARVAPHAFVRPLLRALSAGYRVSDEVARRHSAEAAARLAAEALVALQTRRARVVVRRDALRFVRAVAGDGVADTAARFFFDSLALVGPATRESFPARRPDDAADDFNPIDLQVTLALAPSRGVHDDEPPSEQYGLRIVASRNDASELETVLASTRHSKLGVPLLHTHVVCADEREGAFQEIPAPITGLDFRQWPEPLRRLFPTPPARDKAADFAEYKQRAEVCRALFMAFVAREPYGRGYGDAEWWRLSQRAREARLAVWDGEASSQEESDDDDDD